MEPQQVLGTDGKFNRDGPSTSLREAGLGQFRYVEIYAPKSAPETPTLVSIAPALPKIVRLPRPKQ